MTHIHYEVTVERPAREVWEILADFGGVSRYNPGVRTSRLTGGSPARGEGTARVCELTVPGARVDERIVSWREGEGYTIEIVGGAKLPPFRGAPVAEMSVRPAGAGRSVVAADLRYRLRFGPLGGLMDRAMVRSRFGAAFRGVVAGLKQHAETGQEVTDSTNLASALAALRGAGGAPSGHLAEAA